MKRLAMAALAACIGVTAAAASVPNVPSPSARKAPPKAAAKRYVLPPGKGMIEAVTSADFPRLEQFFRAGAADSYDSDYNNVLHYAVRQCDLAPEVRLKLVRLLVAHGANIHQPNKAGLTPAMAAKASCGAPPAMLTLLVDGKPDLPVPGSSPRERSAELVKRGDQLWNSRDWARSLEAFKAAISIDPTNAKAHFGASLAYGALNDFDNEEAELRLAAANDTWEFYKKALDDTIRMRAPQRAALKAQQAQQAQRNAVHAQGMQLVQRGDQLRASGAYDQAVAAYEQAWHVDEGNAAAFFGEGIAYYQLKKYAMAEWAFQTALKYDPANQAAQSNLQVTRQQIAAANQRFQQTYQRTMQERAQQAQQDRNAELFNNVAQGVALGQQIAQASRPPPRPAPAPAQPAYRPQPNQQVASASPRPYSAPQNAPVAAQPVGGVTGDCITIGPPPPGSGTFWRVYNHCAVPVIGEFCYDGDSTWRCDGHGGGFGPIRAGGFEAIGGPGHQPAMARWSACNYDDWNKGLCKILPAGSR